MPVSSSDEKAGSRIQDAQLRVEAQSGSAVQQRPGGEPFVRVKEEEEPCEAEEGAEDVEMLLNEQQVEQLANQIFNDCATLIQKIWRGYYIRKILRQYLEELESNNLIYG